MEREYVVTLHSSSDLEQFYRDLENKSRLPNIPNRKVTLFSRRPISRSTHYMLTDIEAENLKKDVRVLDVELTLAEANIQVFHCYTETSNNWDKSGTPSNTNGTGTVSNVDRNWGLLRCTNGHASNWGSSTEASGNTTGNLSISGTIGIHASGRNVDVVVIDGHLDPNHPEFAVNSDGTGGTRVNQFNWFSLNASVIAQPVGTYLYTPYTNMTDTSMALNENNNHGCHVAGIAAGNTNGWARNANIFNINPYVNTNNANTSPTFPIDQYVFDYIRVFHQTKSVNSVTGKRNPTICNCSWAYGQYVPTSSITSITFRGTTHSNPAIYQLQNMGLIVVGSSANYYVFIPIRVTSIETAIQDAISEGIIVIAAADNHFMKIDVVGGIDYANVVTSSALSGNFNYMQGGTPSASKAITVGAISIVTTEQKADYSNCGPALDIFAPGSGIISSVNTGLDVISTGGTITTPLNSDSVSDNRNSAYYLKKLDGTSMATPQVTGVLACILETYPLMSQSGALSYLEGYADSNMIPTIDPTGTDLALDNGTFNINDTNKLDDIFSDTAAIQGAPNLFLRYVNERPVIGNTFPKQNVMPRSASTSGVMWPRLRIKL